MKIRDLNRSITKSADDYDEKYMKIKFNSDDKWHLNKTIEIPTMTIAVRAIFLENNKYSPQVFLDECLYKLWIMLYFDRINVSEGVDVNKTSASKEWYLVFLKFYL